MGVCNCSMFCCMLLYVRSSIAIILMGKRELVALLNLSFWCLVMVERLFLAVPRGCLQFVLVVFPDHTHLLFLRVCLEAKFCCMWSSLSFDMQHDIFKRIVGKPYFSDQFKKIVKRHTRVGYNLDIMRQSACLALNPITVYSYGFLFNCTTVGQASDSIMALM